MPQGARTERVGEEFREILAEEIQKLKDPRVGFVTVTGVRVSPDLHVAWVYYTALGDARGEGRRRGRRCGQRRAAPPARARPPDPPEGDARAPVRGDDTLDDRGARSTGSSSQLHHGEGASMR